MLVSIPALIDPHVHYRFPGDTHKEDWKTGVFAALNSGVTTVCDMPNNKPSTVTLEALLEKKKGIDATLKSLGIPFHYALYLGAHKDHIDEIEKAKEVACGIKVFMGSSTGGLLIDDDLILEAIFKKAGEQRMVVAVHAEDEGYLRERKKMFPHLENAAQHSIIRDNHAAYLSVKKAIHFATLYRTPLYILHVSTKEELALIREAKKEGKEVYAEATPHHLFLNVNAYETLGNLAMVNPPLRTVSDQEALWEAVLDGTIDTIGTDHAPHTLDEKNLPYGKAPSGMPGIDTLLPLLLNAVHEKKLTLERVIELTHNNPKKILNLPSNDDFVMVNLTMRKKVLQKDLKTKCGWSPFLGQELVGWPVFTSLNGKRYSNQIEEGESR